VKILLQKFAWPNWLGRASYDAKVPSSSLSIHIFTFFLMYNKLYFFLCIIHYLFSYINTLYFFLYKHEYKIINEYIGFFGGVI
jgi:Ca2+/Na+ antiporter